MKIQNAKNVPNLPQEHVFNILEGDLQNVKTRANCYSLNLVMAGFSVDSIFIVNTCLFKLFLYNLEIIPGLLAAILPQMCKFTGLLGSSVG